MKFKLYCFLIVLAHPCLGLSSTEPSEGTEAWGSFLKIDRDIPIITPEKARDPILRQNLSRTLVAYEEFRSLIKHKGDWVGADFAQGYLSQLNGINLDRPINSLEQRRFVCLLSGHSSAYRRVHYGGFTDRNVQSVTALSYETCEG
jgi:hypothetical protein